MKCFKYNLEDISILYFVVVGNILFLIHSICDSSIFVATEYWLSVRQYSDISLAAVWWWGIIASAFPGLRLLLFCLNHIYCIDFFVDMQNAFSLYKTIYSTWYNNAKNHWLTLTYKKAIHFNRTNTLPFYFHNYNGWFTIYLQLYYNT